MSFKSEAPLPKIINTSLCVLTVVDTEVDMWTRHVPYMGIFGILFGVMEDIRLWTPAVSLGLQKAILESKD